jgi:acyl-CoA reductase-like NAD-dependent aldehyde dehydrogenase
LDCCRRTVLARPVGSTAVPTPKTVDGAADLVAERPTIADLLTREQGEPIGDAEKEICFGIEVIRYYAEEGRRIGGSIRVRRLKRIFAASSFPR